MDSRPDLLKAVRTRFAMSSRWLRWQKTREMVNSKPARMEGDHQPQDREKMARENNQETSQCRSVAAAERLSGDVDEEESLDESVESESKASSVRLSGECLGVNCWLELARLAPQPRLTGKSQEETDEEESRLREAGVLPEDSCPDSGTSNWHQPSDEASRFRGSSPAAVLLDDDTSPVTSEEGKDVSQLAPCCRKDHSDDRNSTVVDAMKDKVISQFPTLLGGGEGAHNNGNVHRNRVITPLTDAKAVNTDPRDPKEPLPNIHGRDHCLVEEDSGPEQEDFATCTERLLGVIAERAAEAFECGAASAENVLVKGFVSALFEW